MSTIPHASESMPSVRRETAAPVMMFQPARAGLSLAILLAGTHLLWSFMVAVGWAQPLADFMFRINFVQPSYTVAPFAAGTAVMLVAVTAGVGFTTGWVVAKVWNWLPQRHGMNGG